MPIDRTAFNTWVNDDGTNTTGTPITKTRIDDDILDPIDAALALASGVPAEQTTTGVGTQNNFNLSDRLVYLRCNNATALTLTGFSVAGLAPSPGDTVIIENIGTSTVKVAHQDTGSTAEHRVISPSTAGQIIGANGLIKMVYDGTTDRWRLALLDPGKPIAVTFAAGDFTADGAMTWTVASGDAVTNAYQQRGKTVTWWVFVQTTTVGGTPNTALRQAIPGGFLPTLRVLQPARVTDNGAAGQGFWQVRSGQSYIEWSLNTGTWALATDASAVGGVVVFEVD